MSSSLRILLLENDVADAELVRETLLMEGIACDVTRVETESDFLSALGGDQTGPFDLILADYALPSFDGLSALKITRQHEPDLPFIFVSGTIGEEVAIEALKVGATDYVLKARLSRLIPSVRRALREAEDRAERKKVEQTLRRREGEFRQVIETIPAMVWTALPDGSNVSMNSRWREYTGSSAAGLSWQAAVHPHDLERHLAAFSASSAAGLPFEDEVRLRRADGEYRWFLVQGMPIRDEQGKTLKWYGIVADIEDRKQQLAHEFDLRLEERVGERTRIARELHDTLLQSFQGLLLRFQTVANLLPARPQDAKQKLESAIDLTAQAITQGRDAVQGLRKVTLSNDLAMALNSHAQELIADNDGLRTCKFRVEVEGTPRNLHPILRDEVYLIAAEALRNAFHHAHARNIELEVRYDNRMLRLRIRDDGEGIDAKVLTEGGREGHFGLGGMRERAKQIGGKLDVWSTATRAPRSS